MALKRMELFQKNRLTKTIGVFIVLLIIIVFFVFTTGFNILLNVSVWVANLFAKNQTQTLNKTTDSYGSIGIDSIPTATNSAQFIVMGSAINYDKLDFFLNDKKVKSVTIKGSDSFTEEIGDLIEGDNEFYIKALNSDTKTKKTTTSYSVFYKNTKPKLEISQPQENEKLSQSEITLKGTTDKEVFVRINDMPVVVDATGAFQTSLRLKEGDNQITITATDIAGNLETKTLTVSYQKE